MPKSELEKQIEKQIKQEKQLADRRRRDEQKRDREAKQDAHKEAIRQQAASIVNGQPLIEGLRIMDATSEEVLRCLLQCEMQQGNHVNYSNDIFPEYVQMSISLEMEKLTQYGMISGMQIWMGGGNIYIQPPAFTYFQNKEDALKRQKITQEASSTSGIINYGNLVFGNVSGSTLTVDNSIQWIEKAIDEQGGEDKEELRELLEEVEELIENMKTSRSVPKHKRLFQSLQNHMEKHGWFYGAVVQLLGTAAMGLIGS